MSPRRGSVSGASGGRVGITALFLVIAAVGMLLLVRAQPDPEPFDPRSDADSGARGLVLLLEREGAGVEVVRSAPAPGSDRRVLILEDRLNDDQRADLLAFARQGGLVVMADPSSTLVDAAGSVGTTSITAGQPAFRDNDLAPQINVPLGECGIAALAHLRGVFVRNGVRFRTSDADAETCFSDASGAFAVVRAVGSGLVVQLGDNEMFTNSLLRYADNGPLATALLAPIDNTQVSILLGAKAAPSTADIGSGEETLSDLVRPGVWMAIAQLAIAFLLFAIARAVRPGRPVREPEQVPIAGSQLVVATGMLMQRAHHAQRAGWLLRGNLHRDVCEHFHLSSTASLEAVDEAVAARTSLPRGHVAAVLDTDVGDDAGLLRLSNSLQEIRDALLLATAQNDERLVT